MCLGGVALVILVQMGRVIITNHFCRGFALFVLYTLCLETHLRWDDMGPYPMQLDHGTDSIPVGPQDGRVATLSAVQFGHGFDLLGGRCLVSGGFVLGLLNWWHV